MNKSNLRQQYVNSLVEKLTIEGESIIWTAYNNRTFQNRTYNLKDSYGSAVYVDGRLVRKSVRYLGAESVSAKGGISMVGPKNKNGWTWSGSRTFAPKGGERRLHGDEILMRGRDEIMDFFVQYTPRNRKGVELVIAAAMYYANILEEGGGNLKHKYRVISGGLTEMKQLAQKYGGSVRKVETGRVLSVAPSYKPRGL